MTVINYLKRVNGSDHIVEHVGWHESGDYLLRLLFEETDKPFRQHKYEVEKEYRIIDKSEIDALERQTCGRRMSDFGPWTRKENIDHWKGSVGNRTCSFCGSLHPSDLIEKVKQEGYGIISSTDKSYKIYVGNSKYYTYHNTDESIEFFKNYNNDDSN